MSALAALMWQSPQWLALSLLLAAGAGVLVGLLYWPQLRALARPWRILLPALRWLAIAAVLLSLARPVAQRPLREEEQGAVVVLVDATASMRALDGQRTGAMLVALADGLGMLPPGTRARAEVFATLAPDIERLPALVDAIALSQVELDVAQLQGKENPAAQGRFNRAVAEFSRVTRALAQARPRLKAAAPRLAEALAVFDRLPPVQSRQWSQVVGYAVSEVTARAQQFRTESDDALYRNNPQVRQACDELAGLCRFELVEKALVRPGTGLISRLPARAPLFGYAIGAGVRPVPLRSAAGEPVRRLLAAPDGSASDLTGGLHDVLEQLRYQKIQAVILFSDGRQVGAEPAIASSVLGGASAPVFTVSPAPPGGGAVRDIAIERLTMPSSLFVGEVLTVTADIRWVNVKSRPQSATLEVDGRQYSEPVEPRPGSPSQGTATFAVAMSQPGPRKIEVSVPPVEGEITAGNNRAVRHVKVLSDKFDVLLLGGSASWDFRYLRDALARTSWINARSMLLESDAEMVKLPPEQIASRDVVILFDLPAKSLSSQQWEAVRTMVAQRGGSIILIAGRAYLPRQYGSDALAEFLPWKRPAQRAGGAIWKQWPGEEPAFSIAPGTSPLAGSMSLSENPGDSAQRWLDLRPVFRYLSMPPLKEIAQPVLVERETGAPILTRHRLGRGNVFFLGIDETWRWRYRVGERDQYRFFQQLIRAAADEPYAVSNDSLSLDAQSVVIAPGETVRVRARLNEPPLDQPYPAALALDVMSGDAIAQTRSLMRVGAEDSGRYEGNVEGLGEGDFRLRVRSPDGAEIEYPLHVVRSYEAEMANLAPDEELLKRLATSSGGEFRTLDNLADLPRALEQLKEHRIGTATIPLWNSWYLYGFVVGCLGLEWALRKRLGMS